MKKGIIFTPRKLARIGLSFLGSIIITLLIAYSVHFLYKKIGSLTATSIEETSKRIERFNLKMEKPLEKKAIDPALEKTIQELTQEIQALEKLRWPRWLYDFFLYFILVCSILSIFIGFKMSILFIGLCFINSGLLLLYWITLFFLWEQLPKLAYFNYALIPIIIILIFDFAYISYLDRKVKKEKS